MHVMIDDPDDIMDYRIASHIVAVHQRQDQAFDVPYTMTDIQLYLKYARGHKPELTAAVSDPTCLYEPDFQGPQVHARLATPPLFLFLEGPLASDHAEASMHDTESCLSSGIE